MIIFFSMAGVLYPSQPQSLLDFLAYCRIPRFESVMRDFPDVDIVICAD
ncbi:MAG: hypothetical protein KGO49_03690 [Gammaproteobacteria bacterium]|nr:hypothetical protein [Gammaproteobacteria bacterium]